MSARITEPGVYDIPAEDYHADPVPEGSLSSTGARRLLSPSCPALFRYEQDNGQEHRAEFDLGHAAHKLVLGVGPDIEHVDAADWKTKAAREQRDKAYQCGAVPLLTADRDRVVAMAAALRTHPLARALLTPDRGKAEQTLVWQDEETGVWRRALVDWLAGYGTRRPILVDYKTTVHADPESIRRSVAKYGYHCQAAWYLDGAHTLGWPDDTAFLFIFQEKTAPHLVSVVELDDIALGIGRERNRRAIDVYVECRTTGHWPGYSDDVTYIALPAWAERRELEEIS